MTDYPLVSVLIPTYNRPAILQGTVDRLRLNLRYAGQLQIIVGNDGDELTDLRGADLVLEQSSGSLGANLNRLIAQAEGDYLFQMDDDHWLIEALDLTPHVEKLMKDTWVGWIRLMGVASHNYLMHMDMTPFSKYIIVDWQSTELYITSNRPHIKRRDFHTRYGMYPEGVKLGETEEGFCNHAKIKAQKDDAPLQVLLPLDVHTESAWEHVGDSWQRKGF